MLDVAQTSQTAETHRKHLIGLVKNEHLHAVGLQEAALDHVLDTTRGTDNDVRTILESLHVITNAGTTNAGVALNVHEVSDSNDDLLDLLSQLTGWGKDQSLALLDGGVELLENGDRESGGLSGSRLSLCNDIATLKMNELWPNMSGNSSGDLPPMTGKMARCWIAEGRSKP